MINKPLLTPISCLTFFLNMNLTTPVHGNLKFILIYEEPGNVSCHLTHGFDDMNIFNKIKKLIAVTPRLNMRLINYRSFSNHPSVKFKAFLFSADFTGLTTHSFASSI